MISERGNDMNGVTGNYNGNNMIYSSGRQQIYQSSYSFSTAMTKAVNQKSSTGSAGFVQKGSFAGKESVVTEYKRKHPEDTANVEKQVNAGKKYLLNHGAYDVSREEMTMEEYQAFVTDLLQKVSFESSRMGDKEIVSISDKGWEQMKNDPEYEAWVFGYTVGNRSVHNPYAAWTGGIFCVEKFGASIEEHHGESISMSKLNGKSQKDEESWWEKRHKRFKELMEEQQKLAQARREMYSRQLQAEASGKYDENVMVVSPELLAGFSIFGKGLKA